MTDSKNPAERFLFDIVDAGLTLTQIQLMFAALEQPLEGVALRREVSAMYVRLWDLENQLAELSRHASVLLGPTAKRVAHQEPTANSGGQVH